MDKGVKEYEERLEFLSRAAGCPRHEVDRIMAYAQMMVDKHGPDVKLDLHEISCWAKVKIERVRAVVTLVNMFDARIIKLTPKIKQAEWR